MESLITALVANGGGWLFGAVMLLLYRNAQKRLEKKDDELKSVLDSMVRLIDEVSSALSRIVEIESDRYEIEKMRDVRQRNVNG